MVKLDVDADVALAKVSLRAFRSILLSLFGLSERVDWAGFIKWTTFILIRSIMGLCHAQWIGRTPQFIASLSAGCLTRIGQQVLLRVIMVKADVGLDEASPTCYSTRLAQSTLPA
jgi:hypothetical protein